jgi:hypothetical protein
MLTSLRLLPLLYFARWGDEPRSPEMKHASILILGVGVIGLTVVNSSVLLGSLGWVIGCGVLARMYVASFRVPSSGKTEAPQL